MPSPPFLATVLVPSPCGMVRSRNWLRVSASLNTSGTGQINQRDRLGFARLRAWALARSGKINAMCSHSTGWTEPGVTVEVFRHGAHQAIVHMEQRNFGGKV